MKIKIATLALLCAVFTGCFNQGVRQWDPVTGKLVTSYRTIGLFDNKAMKGLRVDQTTKSGQKTLLGVASETDTGDAETMKAAGETLGIALGTAMKYSK